MPDTPSNDDQFADLFSKLPTPTGRGGVHQESEPPTSAGAPSAPASHWDQAAIESDPGEVVDESGVPALVTGEVVGQGVTVRASTRLCGLVHRAHLQDRARSTLTRTGRR